MTVDEEQDSEGTTNAYAAFALAYFLVYFVFLWLFVDHETEVVHWVTLVMLPFLGLFLLQRHLANDDSISNAFERVGLVRENLKNGIHVGVLAGLVLGAVQLVLSRSSAEIWQIIVSGKVLYAFPLAFLLMLVTSGFTEEFFFRGVVQTSWARFLERSFWAVPFSAILFGLYHLPYAYLLDSWPSHGDIGAAFSEAVVMATVVGLVLGILYARYANLIVSVVTHSMFNAMYEMTLFV